MQHLNIKSEKSIYCRSVNVDDRFNLANGKISPNAYNANNFRFSVKYVFLKFRYFEQKTRQIKISPSCSDCQNRQINMSSFSDLQYIL